MEKAQIGWKKISYAIATGVVGHIKANMEVCGVRVNKDSEEGIQMVGTRDLASPCGVIFKETEDGIDYVE